jgi:hypothetical protein
MPKKIATSTNTATHVYGSSGFVAGGLGLAVSYKGTDGLFGWLLLAGGWIACAVMVLLIFRLSAQLTSIISTHDEETSIKSEKIGQLETTISNLQREVDRRMDTLDYLSSQLIKGTATPRRPTPPSTPIASPRAHQDDLGEEE